MRSWIHLSGVHPLRVHPLRVHSLGVHLLGVLVGVLVLTDTLLGEDPASTEKSAPAKPKPPVPATALTKLAAQAELLVSVDISIVRAQGGMGGAMMIAGGGASRPPFQGKLEAWRPRGGGLLFATPREMDGFGVYFHDDIAYVTRTGVAGEAPGLKDLTDDLPYLLSREQIQKWAAKAKWKTKQTFPDGRKIHTAKLKARDVGLMTGGGGGIGAMMSMRGKILRVEVEVETDPAGKLLRSAYAVVRNSPMANLAAMGGVQVQGMPGGMQMPKADEEAQRTVFTIKPTAGKPAKRTAALHARFKKLVADEDDE